MGNDNTKQIESTYKNKWKILLMNHLKNHGCHDVIIPIEQNYQATLTVYRCNNTQIGIHDQLFYFDLNVKHILYDDSRNRRWFYNYDVFNERLDNLNFIQGSIVKVLWNNHEVLKTIPTTHMKIVDVYFYNVRQRYIERKLTILCIITICDWYATKTASEFVKITNHKFVEQVLWNVFLVENIAKFF
jgi:hypothetical protein